jgi:predicted PurR-regulated permease PerM
MLSRTLSLAIVLIVSALLVGFGGWLLGASITSQITDLTEQTYRGVSIGRQYLEERPLGNRILEYTRQNPESVMPGKLSQLVPRVLSTSIGALGSLVVGIFLGIFLAIDPARYVHFFVQLLPRNFQVRASDLLRQLDGTLTWWLLGRFCSMLETGILTALGFWLAGVPLPVSLGVLTGLLSFVPNFGPIAASIFSALVGLTVSPLVALYAILVQIAVGIIDGFIVTPLIEQRTVQIPAAVILGAQVIAGVLVGGIGVALATPLAACLFVILQNTYLDSSDRARI